MFSLAQLLSCFLLELNLHGNKPLPVLASPKAGQLEFFEFEFFEAARDGSLTSIFVTSDGAMESRSMTPQIPCRFPTPLYAAAV